MNTSKKIRRTRLSAVLLTGAVLTATAAFAAEPPAETQVTVRAERATAKVVGYSSRGLPVESYQIAYHVNFADLDLASKAGADTLKKRVQDAADSLCKDLDKLYPATEPDRACARTAESSAMAQINTAIIVAKAQEKAKVR